MYDTQSLRHTEALAVKVAPPCLCGKRALRVAVVRMNVIEDIRLMVCQCQPAPLQLLRAGLFPCSPQNPSLAVDVQVLDFVSRLFVNLPPNNTAFWYKLKTKDTLRVRFGNTLEWYISLQQATKERMDQLLDRARDIERAQDETEDDNEAERSAMPTLTPTPSTSRPSTPQTLPPAASMPVGRPVPPAPVRGKQSRRATVKEVEDEDEDDEDESTPPSNPFPEPPPRTRPSKYLISRCPACFGGLVHDPTQIVDIDVCADACFTQKRRRKGARDPPRSHPNSVFVPEPTADQMGAHVDEVRPARGRPAKQARTEEEEDSYEGPNLKVPRSVLNECESSFKAADEKREKASMKFFDDTGIMGLLCRHDRVLWLVNMRTAGEKQYYVLVLLETLFQHLPANIRVSVLYNIACQLHRSCVKYSFLDRYIDRICFAVSVFHAFGHRWLCQMIYHPLKCCGFGFTNGEGCECFWHSISKLIAYLRVSGYHHRLYTIDLQIEHADKTSLGRLAGWLLRWTAHCEGKLREALEDLEACGVAEAVLRAQWADQIIVQTKPVTRKSHRFLLGQAAVEQVLDARQKAQQLFNRVTSLEEFIADEFCTREQQLGVSETTTLNKLKHSDYYSAQMNAKAFKERLRAKLRDRKFELDPIERSFRRTRSENQRNEHAGAAIKRCEPNIARLVKGYNKACEQISTLIKQRGIGAIRYHFELRCDELLQLYVLWKKSLDQMMFDDTDLPEWGPTNTEIVACQVGGVTVSWGDGYDSDGHEEEENEDEDDDNLFQVLQAVDRADNHRRGEDEEEDTWADDDFFEADVSN
ncbi:hypothetical protein B0H17DRAFT_1155465 [Mycena rosella]|uniref:CxC2-like cysteine cluster KDZ transposase-associated domain-containing protein n=1 Tax=Mycena rosella TaxID=1033263 RepID=A0AAD7MCT6_MYCRO|nr:hypothetical protein B0H17DRAFT_1155465 [Mycena rosella]